MKFLISAIFIILGVAFSACSTHQDDNYYDRANRASEKSLEGLERDTQ